MEKSSFFNSVNGDRKYQASSFAEYFASFIANGVFPNPSTGLQAAATNSMIVTLKAGRAWINGYIYTNSDDLLLNIDTADGVLKRIDKVVIQYSTINREIKAKVKKGTFASNPVAPVLQRDSDIYELGIADIYIANGAVSISQANITDLRLNKDLCGIVHGTVDQVDTTAIFNQFQSWYSQKQSEYNTDFQSWTQAKKDAFDSWYTLNTQAFIKQFNDWYSSNTTKWSNDFANWFVNTNTWEQQFNTWFNTIKTKLDGDIAAKLTADVADLKDGKVDKVDGKGLSTNDYTNDDKTQVTKISGIEYSVSTIKAQNINFKRKLRMGGMI